VLGLSLRDLQVLLYWQLGQVLSRNAVHQVTLRMQERMVAERQSPIQQTPTVLIVDGVWVEVQYTTGEVKVDRSGHQRQVRQAHDRVILAVMAVWPEGTHEMLHYEIAQQEDTAAWQTLFEPWLTRGLDPKVVEVVVSDGAKGLLAAMEKPLPQTHQQRCITHKVRGMDPYLKYQQLPTTDEQGQPLERQTAKEQRKSALFKEAYEIYDAPSYEEAQQRYQAFVNKWHELEPEAIHAFQWGLKRTFTFYQLDASWHRFVRTTNALERFFENFAPRLMRLGPSPMSTAV
jgi:transposase-like protein